VHFAKGSPTILERVAMKKLLCVVLSAAALLPVAVFAQTSGSQVSRAQVRGELAQLEAVGYRPSTHDVDYPQALQTAEAKVAAMNSQHDAYGGVGNNAQASGSAHSGLNLNGRSR
jgi:hypothetical protein